MLNIRLPVARGIDDECEGESTEASTTTRSALTGTVHLLLKRGRACEM